MQHGDNDTAAWQLSHEKSMCLECHNAHPEKLYCVHPDHIRAVDAVLAAVQVVDAGCGVGVAAGRVCGHVQWQCEAIADDLWREFMLVHQTFTGKLTEVYMRA